MIWLRILTLATLHISGTLMHRIIQDQGKTIRYNNNHRQSAPGDPFLFKIQDFLNKGAGFPDQGNKIRKSTSFSPTTTPEYETPKSQTKNGQDPRFLERNMQDFQIKETRTLTKAKKNSK